MKNHTFILHRLLIHTVIVLGITGTLHLHEATAQTVPRWKAHDLGRPHPPVVTPASRDLPVPPPSDAIVLFDGTDLSKWCGEDGGNAPWIVKDGAMVPACKGDDIYTARPFGDVQLHVEWAAPLPPAGEGQGRGNSGIFLMGLYEVQVLDSYENDTYSDGQAAAVYGQYPPLVNASLPPGKWQTYDILFLRPRFLPDGALSRLARLTVLHNGVLVQESAELWGPTMWLQHLPYEYHPDKLPISLQDHGSPVRFRNIWVRELREIDEPGPARYDTPPAISLTREALDRYVGIYKYEPDSETAFVVKSDGRQLYFLFGKKQARVDLVPHSLKKFSMRWAAARVEFQLDGDGRASAMTLHVAGSSFTVKRLE